MFALAEAHRISAALTAAFAAGSIERIALVYAPDATFWHNHDETDMPIESVLVGLADILQTVESLSMQDVSVVGVMPDGFVQSCRFVGMTRHGRKFGVPACQLISVRDGRIAAVREYYDPTTFQRAFT